ncbi:LysM peptidoglycan-binding domain-containing protein [Azospirillum sp. B21]|uniref:LysM peptidoglycan-binding domain-containing protein n=1 Tax=Azospirillum sp. B21 TaxID=2607496 RepID=UPI0011EE1EFC|nr:LysM domain-containing protein [Azospirillum sp. B21]KAA0573997.1 LysM peptidoglycan-binding domain-containing protein [Azospirillum sp. B21]
MRLPICTAATLFAIAAAWPAQAQVTYYGTPVVAGPMMGVLMAAPVVAAPVVAPVMAAPVVAGPVAYATSPSVRGFYQVKQGGRLETVARKVGVSLADLVRLNPLLDPQERLVPGTLVALPVP